MEYKRTGTDRHWPGLADSRLKVQWRWKLQRVCRTDGLCLELPSCDMRCNPAVEEEEDYDVMYSIDCVTELSISGMRRTSSLPFFSLGQSNLGGEEWGGVGWGWAGG